MSVVLNEWGTLSSGAESQYFRTMQSAFHAAIWNDDARAVLGWTPQQKKKKKKKTQAICIIFLHRITQYRI